MVSNSFKLLWLRQSFPWMGQHSGYEQFCDVAADLLQQKNASIWKTSKPLHPLLRRPLNRISRKVQTSATYSVNSTWLELQAIRHCLISRYDLVHTLYVEADLGLLPDWKKRLNFKLIGTVHQPTSLWRMRRHAPESVRSLDELIVLSCREAAYFEQYLPGHVHVVPHGIDTDFFCPAPGSKSAQAKPRFVFCGIWLRDIETLGHVIDTVISKEPSIQFDLVVPVERRLEAVFYRMARHEQVTWHAGISDEQLRELYRRATALVLPLIDCTANNALLEAIACGLPIVSNNVGGTPDYTCPSFADLLSVGDVDGMVEAILKLANDPDECAKRGVAARAFADQHLTWEKITAQTLGVYQKALLGNQ